MPLVEAKSEQGLSVLEVDDPKLVVLIHLMSPLEPIEPMLESPLAAPALKQSSAASDLLHEVASSNTTAEAMLLANIEKNGKHRFLIEYKNLQFGSSIIFLYS